jgi:hypothetical protein
MWMSPPTAGSPTSRHPKADVSLANETGRGLAMVDFANSDHIKRWLEPIKPAKRRREVALAMAARSALRVTPLVGGELTQGKRSALTVLSDFVLPSLRATALAWVVAKYPRRAAELQSFAASAAVAALSAVVDAAYLDDAPRIRTDIGGAR